MTDVFISYSRKDKDFVSTLYAAFERSQKNIWVDWNNIPLTSDWWAEIEKGIEAADTFVFVISPDSIASEVCTKEIDHAVLHNKRLFPIVRRDATNFEVGNDAHKKIQQHNWLMFREEDDFEKSFKMLTETISLDLEHLHSHTRLLVRAIEWSKGRSDSLLLRRDDLASAEQWLEESVGKDPKPTELQETYIKNSRDVEDASDRAAAIIQEALEESKKKAAEAAANLEESEKKAALRIKIGSGILAGTILLAVVAGVSATKFVNEANVRVDKTEKDAKDKLKSADLAVVNAQKKADDIQKVSEKDARDAAQKVRDANEKKKEADLKVESAQRNLESAKAEAEKVSQESAEKVAAAQVKIMDAESKVKESLQKQEQANLESQKSLEKVAAAEKKLANTEARVKKEIQTKILGLRKSRFITDLDIKTIEAIANGDIDKLVRAETIACGDYEFRDDLGNTQKGDGERFKGRGYWPITGRINYYDTGKKIGVDLITDPEKALEPQIAAMVLVQLLDDQDIKKLLIDTNNLDSVRRRVNGGSNGLEEVTRNYQMYLEAIKAKKSDAGIFEIPELLNTDWLKVHVPAILKVMRERNITDIKYKAYILATADTDSSRGTFLTEICR
jgi:predicted chitinase